MNEKTKTVTVGSLVSCPSIVAIRPVNILIANRYAQAMRSGDKFPAIVIDADNHIISGNTRHAAYMAEYGEDHKIEVVIRKYKTEADRIEDSVRDNARHGYPLDGISRNRAALALAEHGRTPEQIANLLGISVRRVEQWGSRTVIVTGNGKPKPMPIKRSLSHMIGSTVSIGDYNAHMARDRGIKAVEMARQLTRHLEADWIDWQDQATVDAMYQLFYALEQHLKTEKS